MSISQPSPDPSLVWLMNEASGYLGQVEQLDEEKRLWLLGAFLGGVSRLRSRLRELYEQADDDDRVEAAAQLRQVAIALGEDENWERR